MARAAVDRPVAEPVARAGDLGAVAALLSAEVAQLPADRCTPAAVLAGFLAALPEDRDLVLVPHSQAGLYVAPLAAARRVVAVHFVDAGVLSLNGPTPTATPGAADRLAKLADENGLLPGWTSWWPEDDVAALFPSPSERAAVEAEQVRLPLSYFTATVPSPPAWTGLPCRYLAFGGTYAAEQRRARGLGWPVRVLEGRHLHQLVDPAAVAAVLLG